MGTSRHVPGCGCCECNAQICVKTTACSSLPQSGVAIAITSGGSVASIAVTAAGTGYTSNPTVTITGDGTGATATATRSGTTVLSITVTNAGIGYATATVTITGGAGSGATATATLNSRTTVDSCTTAPDGTVGAVAVTGIGGSGYTSNPTVTFSAPGGSGVTATGTATRIGTSVSAVTVTNPGSGYATAPTVSFSGGGGSGAAAVAHLTQICCIDAPAAGTYAVRGTLTGYTSVTQSAVVVCGTDTNVTLSIAPACLRVTVNGCNSLPLAGVSVSLTQSTIVYGPVVTNASGQALFGLPTTASCSISVTAPSARFSNNTGTGTPTAGGIGSATVTLAAAAGYNCCSITGCAHPFPSTLTLTDSQYGTFTLSFSGTCQWVATPQVDTPGGCHGCAAAVQVGIKYTLILSGATAQLNLGWQAINPGVNECGHANTPWSNVSGGTTHGYTVNASSLVCPTATAISFTGLTSELHCSAPTITVTE